MKNRVTLVFPVALFRLGNLAEQFGSRSRQVMTHCTSLRAPSLLFPAIIVLGMTMSSNLSIDHLFTDYSRTLLHVAKCLCT